MDALQIREFATRESLRLAQEDAKFNIALKIAKISFFLALTILCVCAVDTLKHVRATADTLTTTLQVTAVAVGDADRTITGIDSRLNAKGGLFDIVKATALHADRAVGEAAIASRQQRVAAERVDREILSTVQHVNVTMDALAGNIRTTTEDVHNSLVRVPALLDATNATITSANRVISDSNIPATLANIDNATKEVNVTLQHVSGVTAHLETMSGDLEKSLHKTLNPTKKSLALGWVMTGLKLGAALSPLY